MRSLQGHALRARYMLHLFFCAPLYLSVWASSASLFVCICHSASVVWCLGLWFLSSQHSSKYSDKIQHAPRSLGPLQSIREKTTQRCGCFCSIKQPSEQQQPFSVWDVELIHSHFLPIYLFFQPSSFWITESKKETVTNPAVRGINCICDCHSVIYPVGPQHNQSSVPKENLVVDESQWICNSSKPRPELEYWTYVMQQKVSRVFGVLAAYRIRDNVV